jgi:hypothetical protein
MGVGRECHWVIGTCESPRIILVRMLYTIIRFHLYICRVESMKLVTVRHSAKPSLIQHDVYIPLCLVFVPDLITL